MSVQTPAGSGDGGKSDGAQLVAMALGPVQDFIAQARRSRDLWFGSHVLSEISKAAARSLAQAGATLIFPPWDAGAKELQPSDGPRQGGESVMAASNKLLAILPRDVDAGLAVAEAREAARRRWRDIARSVFAGGGKAAPALLLDPKIREAEAANETGEVKSVWSDQIERLLEIYAAWRPVHDADFDAASARDLRRLAAGARR